MATAAKGACIGCGKTGTVRAVTRHTMQCSRYREYRVTHQTSELLDPVVAWAYAQSETGQQQAAQAAEEARDERGLARRERQETALSVSRSRWTDGKGGFTDGVPTAAPDEGVLHVRSPQGSARAAVEAGWFATLRE